jgi:MoaA/NifB/PqqE/SkfB family radical SAM enzyme
MERTRLPFSTKPADALRLFYRAANPGRRRHDFPYKLTFVATERCNLRCRACRIWENGAEGMPVEDIRAFFARSNRFSWIDVTGGEIFLRDDIVDVFSAITGQCRKLALLHFPTNGFLTEKIVATTREILRMKPVRLVVTVSVDGPPELHDTLRGADGSFDRAIETYARLRELPGCRPYLGMTLSEDNLGAVDETLDAVREHVPGVGPGDLHVNLFQRSEHYYRNAESGRPDAGTLSGTVQALRRKRGFSMSPLNLVERRHLALAGKYLEDGKSPIPCQALSASCFVDAGGTVFPCVTWNRPLGRLADFGFDLKKLWDSPEALRVRAEIRAGGCPGCWTSCESVPAMLAQWWRIFI